MHAHGHVETRRKRCFQRLMGTNDPRYAGGRLSTRIIGDPDFPQGVHSCFQLHRVTGGLPLGETIFQASSRIALRTQRRDPSNDITQYKSATVRHLASLPKVRETSLQFVDGYIDGSGQMPECELFLRAHVEQRYRAVLESSDEPLARDGFHRIALMEKILHDSLNLGELALADLT